MTISAKLLFGMALASLAPATATLVVAQAPAAATQGTSQVSRIVGTIAAIDGKALTIKSDAGTISTVSVSDTARILRAEPGAKTLADATAIQLSDLTLGDRVLVTVQPTAPGTAVRIIAMKESDITQRQQAEQSDWQRRGAGGIVKNVDSTAATVAIASGSRTLVIHVSPKTVVRRYDPESIKFSDAKPSSLNQIRPGDQLRVRGERNADGSEIDADEIIAGSFRNIAGTVDSVDAAANTVTVTDLATKKPVVIRVTSDSQMHKLPQTMAQAIAARLKNPNAESSTGQPGEATPGTGQPPPGGAPRQGAAGAPGGQRGDLSQMLQRTPTVQVSDLHKGDAVMIVATGGASTSATALTLLAGVEPLLTASPAASQSMFSASWNLGGGGATDAAGTP